MEQFFSPRIFTLLMTLSECVLNCATPRGRAECLVTLVRPLLPNVKDGSYSWVRFLVVIACLLDSAASLWWAVFINFFSILLCFLAWVASPGIEILSAVISTINGHNKVALKLCRAKAVIGGQLQAHAIMEGKLRGSTVCSLVQISVPFHNIRL